MQAHDDLKDHGAEKEHAERTKVKNIQASNVKAAVTGNGLHCICWEWHMVAAPEADIMLHNVTGGSLRLLCALVCS